MGLNVAAILFSALLTQATPVQFPAQDADQGFSSQLMSWRGWGYLQGTPSVEPKVYDSLGDWSEIKARFTSIKAAKPSTWHQKVVILTRTESDGRDSSGVLRENRKTIESVQLAQVQAALERFKAWAIAKYDGRVVIAQDVQIEGEWMRVNSPEAGGDFGPGFAKKYLEARFNGGSYEAEDKIFRGPYNSVIYILPGASQTPIIKCQINGTPVAGISAVPLKVNGETGYLDNSLRSVWLEQVEARLAEQGFKGITQTANAPTSEDPWPIATSLDEAAPQAFLSRLASTLELWPFVSDPAPGKLSKLPGLEASLAADGDKGQVFKVVETGGYRLGGVALPARSDGMPISKLDSTPTLSFQVKTSARDPLSIRLVSSEGKSIWLSIGRDPLLVQPMLGVIVGSVPISPDAKWHAVSVDLRPLAEKAGMTNVAWMSIEPSPNAKLAGRNRPEPIEYLFDELKFSADPAQPLMTPVAPDPASDDEESRALYAAQAKASSPELAALLKDKSELVRLNSSAAYITIKDPSVEGSLVSNSLDLDPTVAAASLRALMGAGTDSAVAIVRRSVRISLSDYAKMIAARLLAETKDPKMGGDISLMFNNRSWNARLSGVESLAMIPGTPAGIMRLVFIRGDDPEIKLAVTRNTDPNREEDVSKLLWSAVNEPSDVVRVESDIKLIQSSSAVNRTEGYKGVRDDSRFVRLSLLEYLTANPSEGHRNALRTAVADKSAAVRGAALRGFAALENGTTADEIANVMDDQNPVVQLALIDLAGKKHIKLPQKTLEAMASSADSKVSAAVKGLSGQ